ncbi:hypothetical protein H671_xg20189 [Cricetulus griseus]|nr:hypothetical protein H671_xg20189 [Cricetulus griseus]
MRLRSVKEDYLSPNKGGSYRSSVIGDDCNTGLLLRGKMTKDLMLPIERQKYVTLSPAPGSLRTDAPGGIQVNCHKDDPRDDHSDTVHSQLKVFIPAS